MDIKLVARQYVKMAIQNMLLPLVYNAGRHRQIEKGLVVFADAHHDSVPPSMEPLVRELKRRGSKKIVEIYDDYQNISFVRLFSDDPFYECLCTGGICRDLRQLSAGGFLQKAGGDDGYPALAWLRCV